MKIIDSNNRGKVKIFKIIKFAITLIVLMIAGPDSF